MSTAILDRRAKTRTPSFPNINVKNNNDGFYSRVCLCRVISVGPSASLVAHIFIAFKIAKSVDDSTRKNDTI